MFRVQSRSLLCWTICILVCLAGCRTAYKQPEESQLASAADVNVDRMWISRQVESFESMQLELRDRWPQVVDLLVDDGGGSQQRLNQQKLEELESLVKVAQEKVTLFMNQLSLIKEGFSRGDDVAIGLTAIERTQSIIVEEVQPTLFEVFPLSFEALRRNLSPRGEIVRIRRDVAHLTRAVGNVVLDLKNNWQSTAVVICQPTRESCSPCVNGGRDCETLDCNGVPVQGSRRHEGCSVTIVRRCQDCNQNYKRTCETVEEATGRVTSSRQEDCNRCDPCWNAQACFNGFNAEFHYRTYDRRSQQQYAGSGCVATREAAAEGCRLRRKEICDLTN